MRVKCRCGKYAVIDNLNTHGDFSNTGKPKRIGDGKCDCGLEVEVYITVRQP